MSTHSKRPTLLLLDWDGTLTTTSTLPLIASIATLPGIHPSLEGLSAAYSADLKHHNDVYFPSRNDRTTLPQEIAYLSSLQSVERASIERLEASEIFKGVRTGDIDHAAAETFKRGTITLRPGWTDLIENVQRRAHNGKVAIISVAWSRRFIAHILAEANSAAGGTRIAIDDIIIKANEIDEDGSGRLDHMTPSGPCANANSALPISSLPPIRYIEQHDPELIALQQRTRLTRIPRATGACPQPLTLEQLLDWKTLWARKLRPSTQSERDDHSECDRQINNATSVSDNDLEVYHSEEEEEREQARRYFQKRGHGIWTAADKALVMEQLVGDIRGKGAGSPFVVYIGDSPTDLTSLINADIGICIRDEPMTSEQKALRETLERVGVGCLPIERYSVGADVADAEIKGKRLWWAGDLSEVVESGVLDGG